MANKWKELSEEARDRKEFQKLVSDKTKPIRRGAYLKEKIKQAVEEGYLLAAKEKMVKEERKRTIQDFGINKKEMKEIESRKQPSFKNIREVKGEDILAPTIDFGWNNQDKFLGKKLNKDRRKNGK